MGRKGGGRKREKRCSKTAAKEVNSDCLLLLSLKNLDARIGREREREAFESAEDVKCQIYRYMEEFGLA